MFQRNKTEEEIKDLEALQEEQDVLQKESDELNTLTKDIKAFYKDDLTEEEQEALAFLKDDSTRALSEVTEKIAHGADNVSFGPTANDGRNALFLGANVTGKGKASVIRARLIQNDANEVSLSTLAPQTVKLNGVDGTKNPLFDAKIKDFVLTSVFCFPVVAVEDPVDKNVYLLKADGKMVLKTESELLDVKGAKAPSGPLSVSATKRKGFAKQRIYGVIPAAMAGDDFGVVVVDEETNKLVQIDPDQDKTIKAVALKQKAFADTPATEAAKINHAFFSKSVADKDPSKVISKAVISSKHAICWNEKLKRYFVAVSEVTRDSTTKEGGIFSVLVGGTGADGKEFVKPVVASPRSDLFPAGAAGDQAIIGFHRSETEKDAFLAAAFKACPMHTSGGKDYLIINGGVSTDTNKLKSHVNALPIMPAGDPNAGQLARTNGTKPFTLLGAAGGDKLATVDRAHTSPAFDPTAKPADQFTAAEKRIVIGADPRFVGGADTDLQIQDIQVIGDSVLVAVAGDRDKGQEAGIFQATAVQDSDGLICGFTPWQRVAGTTDIVFGFGMDRSKGNFQFLTTNVPNG